MGEAVFDKEDDLAVEFVTAASNLRAAAYGIPQQSQFDAKVGMLSLTHSTMTIARLSMLPCVLIPANSFWGQTSVNEDCALHREWQATLSMLLPRQMLLSAD